jgi:hypothetical protein
MGGSTVKSDGDAAPDIKEGMLCREVRSCKPDPGRGSWPGVLACSRTFLCRLGAKMNPLQFSENFTRDLHQLAMDEV